MATKTDSIHKQAENAAKKWRAGVAAYLEETDEVYARVKEHAASMPHETPEDSEKIVSYVTEEFKKLAAARRDAHARHTKGE